MLAPLPLTESEIVTLEAAAANGPHPRMRRRAQAVLGHHRGLGQLATLYAVGYNAVNCWLLRWQRHGVAGLAEGMRAGRPPKLPEPVQKK